MAPRLVRRLASRVQAMTHTARFLARVAKSTQRPHLLRWIRSQRPDYLLSAPSPWITFDAIDDISRFLRTTQQQGHPCRVFEYGSGGSTLFWAANGAACVSVEHDPAWFQVVRDHLDGVTVDYRLIAPEPAIVPADADRSDPELYLSTDDALLNFSFRRYAEAIDEFPNGQFDLVLVDGRARPSCIVHAAPKVRPGGLLVVDNADREYYLRNTMRHLTQFTRRAFPGIGPVNSVFTQTDVFVRVNS